MSPTARYSLARLAIFLVCALPALFLLPREIHSLLKLMIAAVLSAVVSHFVLRRQRDQMAWRLSEQVRRRGEERRRLRAALAGEDEDRDTDIGETGP